MRRERYPRWVGATARALLKLLGWRLLGERPAMPKCVMVGAPHRTNWDMFFFLLMTCAYETPAMFTMKKSWFFWPLGPVWRWLGGIPIDRGRRTNIVEQLAGAFSEAEVLRLAIPPEGTRKNVDRWKMGFYWIARGAGVPLVLGHISYARKEVGLGAVLDLTGDTAADLDRVKAYYLETIGLEPRFQLDGEPDGPGAKPSPRE